MNKNFKSVVCCVLTLLLIAGTIVFAFAGNNGANVLEPETASEVESEAVSEATPEVTTESSSEAESEVTDSDKPVMGDMDGNGELTPADARLALRLAAGLDFGTDEQLKLADVNGDGYVRASDARSILRVSVGLDLTFEKVSL